MSVSLPSSLPFAPRDPIVAAARGGLLCNSEMSMWWSLLFWHRHQIWPKGDAIPAGVRRDFGRKISRTAAYRGLTRARRLPQSVPEAGTDHPQTGSQGPSASV